MAITEGPRKTTGERCHRIGRALVDLEKRGVWEQIIFCMYWLCMCTRVQLYVSVSVGIGDWLNFGAPSWTHDFIQLSKLHDANAARIRSWRKPWLPPPTKSHTRDFSCPHVACQPVEALKPNAAECPPFYDMPTESNLCASGSWLDASPEHHFETNP